MNTETEEQDVQSAAADAAVAAVSENGESPGIVTTSQGIKFKVKVVPPLFLRRATQQIAEPKPPVIFREDKDREEENSADPDYRAAHERWQQAINMASMDVMLLLGTELDHLPDGIPSSEDAEWLDILDTLNIEVKRDSPKAKYLAWMHYILADVGDLAKVIDAISECTGVKEEDVAAAMQSFRGGEARGADNESPEATVGGHGDQVQPDGARARTGNRRARRSKA